MDCKFDAVAEAEPQTFAFDIEFRRVKKLTSKTHKMSNLKKKARVIISSSQKALEVINMLEKSRNSSASVFVRQLILTSLSSYNHIIGLPLLEHSK